MIIDSERMTNMLLFAEYVKLANREEYIGVLVSACPGIAYGWLYYKELEKIKRLALNNPQNNPNTRLTLTSDALRELNWWDSQILKAKNKIRHSNFEMEIFSDASKTGWGATYKNEKTGGFWTNAERKNT